MLSLNFVNAQSPTFYTGNANSPSNSYPFNNAGGQTMQSLIAPGEFTGATFGFITKFYVQGTANVAGSWNGLTVRMGQITPTTLPTASFVPSTALTTVYSATSTSITSTAAGWLLITLQTPFLYDPSQSLVVEITQCASVGGAFSVTNVSKAGSFRRSWSPPGNCSVTYSGQAADLFNCGVDMRSAGGNDAGVTAITSPTLFCSPGIQNINATIKNFGTNQVTSVNVNWSINGNLQTPLTYTSLLDTFGGAGSTTANVNLGSFNFPATLTNIKVWTSLPNSVNDTIFVNDTASGSYQQSMAGTFTIGGTPGPTNFTSFENAISAMEFAGICGPVVFNVAPGIYNRTTAIAVSDIVGTSNINTITFDGGNKNNCILKGTIPTSPIFIIRSKHTTFKNFSVENSSITTPVGIAVTGSASKVTISNCNVRLPVLTGTSSSGFCINVSGNITGVAAMSGDSITVDSCYTVGGGYGVVMYGSSNVNANRGMVLTNSTIDSCNYMGGYISYNYNPVVINNNTFNMQGWNYGYYGLYAYYNQSSDAITPHRITNNKINNFGYYGMYIYYPMSNTTAAAPLIANNVVSSFNGGSYSGFYGIYIYNYNA
ncbi:MAG: hypothetical protein KBG11_05875, partial [Bacteroidia bacterium]|nr:hypothetical protein [Bacteroidia bacterium]